MGLALVSWNSPSLDPAEQHCSLRWVSYTVPGLDNTNVLGSYKTPGPVSELFVGSGCLLHDVYMCRLVNDPLLFLVIL